MQAALHIIFEAKILRATMSPKRVLFICPSKIRRIIPSSDVRKSEPKHAATVMHELCVTVLKSRMEAATVITHTIVKSGMIFLPPHHPPELCGQEEKTNDDAAPFSERNGPRAGYMHLLVT